MNQRSSHSVVLTLSRVVHRAIPKERPLYYSARRDVDLEILMGDPKIDEPIIESHLRHQHTDLAGAKIGIVECSPNL